MTCWKVVISLFFLILTKGHRFYKTAPFKLKFDALEHLHQSVDVDGYTHGEGATGCHR